MNARRAKHGDARADKMHGAKALDEIFHDSIDEPHFARARMGAFEHDAIVDLRARWNFNGRNGIH